jgi:pimeloyl-ACP methyl ester carboxylesterase
MPASAGMTMWATSVCQSLGRLVSERQEDDMNEFVTASRGPELHIGTAPSASRFTGSHRHEGLNQTNEMDGIELNAAGMSRRLLVDAGLLGATFIAAGADRAEGAGGGFSALQHGANDPLPVESHLAIQSKTPAAVTPEALAAYIRTYSEPAAIHAVCEDYRAAAGIDSRLLTASRAAGQKMTPPLLAIWGGKGTVGQEFNVVGLWKQEALTVSGHPLPCGHLIPEEDPDGFLASLDAFLTS